jgi:hypothetical protein
MIPEEIEPSVSAALKVLQTEIDDSHFCPRASFERDKALLMVTGKCLRLGLAVCHLISAGFYGEALGLTRSVLEAFFIVKYISNSKEGEARAHSYIEFKKAHLFNRDQIREKYCSFIDRPSWITQELIDEVKKLPSTRHWVSARKMATEESDHPLDIDPSTGKGFQAYADYDGTYELASQYVHCTIISSMPNFSASPFTIQEGDVETDKGFLALHFSLLYSYQVCLLLGRNWDVVIPQDVTDKIEALLFDLRANTSPTAMWIVGLSKTP